MNIKRKVREAAKWLLPMRSALAGALGLAAALSVAACDTGTKSDDSDSRAHPPPPRNYPHRSHRLLRIRLISSGDIAITRPGSIALVLRGKFFIGGAEFLVRGVLFFRSDGDFFVVYRGNQLRRICSRIMKALKNLRLLPLNESSPVPHRSATCAALCYYCESQASRAFVMPVPLQAEH